MGWDAMGWGWGWGGRVAMGYYAWGTGTYYM